MTPPRRRPGRLLLNLLLVVPGAVEALALGASCSRTAVARPRRAALTMRRGPPGRLASSTLLLALDEESGGDVSWRLQEAIDLVEQGGCGVIPTDASYSFITRLSSRDGVQRILRLKGEESSKKPLSLLCADLAMVDQFVEPMDKKLFKLLKRELPGPYTFILPASSNLPKLHYSADKKGWKRKEIGVRIPDDEVCAAFLNAPDMDGEPLLCSTVPLSVSDDDGRMVTCALDSEPWCTQVDFIVDAGPRSADGSTVYSFLDPWEPQLLRAGLGNNALVDDW